MLWLGHCRLLTKAYKTEITLEFYKCESIMVETEKCYKNKNNTSPIKAVARRVKSSLQKRFLKRHCLTKLETRELSATYQMLKLAPASSPMYGKASGCELYLNSLLT